MHNSDILRHVKRNSNLSVLLRSRINPRINLEKNLDIATKYYIEHKSTTKIAQEYSISASRVSDILELYELKIAPLLVKIISARKERKI
ncbi:MAG: hypothetical protein G01um10147_774 [Microgenomates group bacterium Gr01-1014_7]|nr:MAG: hypothetical protein G01um10147_774 [Microgenomates group bacterium Gr01-1014_7]